MGVWKPPGSEHVWKVTRRLCLHDQYFPKLGSVIIAVEKEFTGWALGKVITQDGKVTLRGPARSEGEKSNLQAKAVAVAGEENVTHQLEIAPSK